MKTSVFIFALMASGCLSFHSKRMPDAPESATFFRTQNTEIHYKVTGPDDAETIVLIHGFASSLNAWHRVQPELSNTHRVISLDLQGFGLSGRPPGDYSPQAQAEIVRQLLDHLGVTQATLVAHSWGSSVALALAVAHPTRVDKIVLYDAWVYDAQLPSFFRWSRAPGIGETLFALFYKERPADKMEQAFYDPSIITYEYTEVVRHSLDRPGTTAAALEAVRGQRFETLETHYANIAQPVLLLWGRQDNVTTLHVGERLVKDLPNARLEVFDQCGHFPMEEAFHPSTRALKEFVGGQP